METHRRYTRNTHGTTRWNIFCFRISGVKSIREAQAITVKKQPGATVLQICPHVEGPELKWGHWKDLEQGCDLHKQSGTSESAVS